MKRFLKLRRYKSFTLAEVLITLMVIGVLAVITIPSILQSWQEQATVAQLRKTYSVLQQAYQLSVNDNGAINGWGWTGDWTDSKIALKKFQPYLNAVKVCDINEVGCTDPRNIIKKLTNIDYKNASLYSRLLLADNTSVMFRFISDSVFWIYVDINGPQKGGFRLGEDVFVFQVTSAPNIIPMGMPGTTLNPKNYCNIGSDNDEQGMGCAAWVIKMGNMKYLKTPITNTDWP